MIEHSSFNKLVGTTLGNYRLDHLIERNKMGPIFIARSSAAAAQATYLLRILDVQNLLAGLPPETRILYLGQFQQEANKVAALQHPSILPLLDYGNSQGVPYLVSPHYPTARSLHAHLAQYGPADPLTTSRYLDQIAAALEYAHQHAILHRNLTANSILIDSPPSSASSLPRLLIADFGTMRMLELALSLAGQEQKGYLTYGSSEASSPEQLLGKPVNTTTDIYALGAVGYRILTGQRVYSGNTQDEVVQQHLSAPIPPLSKWRKNLPAGLDSVIARAMAKEPEQRFQRPLEFADAYHQVAAPNDSARPPFAIAAPPAGAQPIALAGVSLSPRPSSSKDLKRASQAPLRTPAGRSQQVSRRRVLFLIVAGGGAAAAAVTAVALFGSHFSSGSAPTATTGNTPATGSTPTTVSSPAATTAPAHTGTVIAHTTDVSLNSAKTFSISGHTNPGVLVHLSNNNFVAFDSTCTHAGCAVSYNPQDKLLECPCHGASFDPAKNAAVVTGPALTPLAPVNITVNADGTITTSS